MTVHISLPTCEAGPSRLPLSNEGLGEVVTAIRSSRRIVVVCGAGVSTAASIPDFRSSSGLFSAGEKGKGKESVKDLFHVKAISSPTLLAAHHSLINELASMSFTASPTPFHQYLAGLDLEGRLLRVYTQNIDGLEEKAGLPTGVPSKPPSPRKSKNHSTPTLPSPRSFRVIPLHGTLSYLHCTLCSTSLPLLPHLPLPDTPLPCPTCDLADSIRCALSERRRNSGRLRPSIVLYGEEHPQGDLVGQVVERDIKGNGGMQKEGRVDFLLVAGTSLSIPGVKRIVKEMAKVVHHKSPTKASRVRTVLVNDELPKGDWSEVFDVWVKGDIQKFITDYLDNTEYQSTPITPTKKKRRIPDTPSPINSTTKKRRQVVSSSSDFTTPPKSRGNDWYPTPRDTPPSPTTYQKGGVEGPGSPIPLAFISVTQPAIKRAFGSDGSLTPISERAEDDGVKNPFLDLGHLLD